MSGKTSNPDPVFAAEMAAVAADRARDDDFASLWAERLKRPMEPAYPPSTLHTHDADCLGEEIVRLVAPGTFAKVRPCKRFALAYLLIEYVKP